PYSEVTLTVNRASSAGLEVAVSFDNLCASLIPMATWYLAAESAGSIPVAAPAGCAWTATSDVPWIVITSGASGTGAGAVGYKVLANAAGDQRIGSLTIQRRAFSISQAGLNTTARLSWVTQTGNLSFTATAGSVPPQSRTFSITSTAWPL